MVTLGIVSDIHYAGAAERARGNDYEIRGLANPLLRLFVRGHRHFVWKRDPLNQNHLLDGFLATVQAAGQAHLGGTTGPRAVLGSQRPRMQGSAQTDSRPPARPEPRRAQDGSPARSW